MAFETELAYYERIKEDLLQHYLGKYVLIVGEERLGVFDKSEDAYITGLRLRGNIPMLIKKVEPMEPTELIPAMVLGLVNAHIQ